MTITVINYSCERRSSEVLSTELTDDGQVYPLNVHLSRDRLITRFDDERSGGSSLAFQVEANIRTYGRTQPNLLHVPSWLTGSLKIVSTCAENNGLRADLAKAGWETLL